MTRIQQFNAVVMTALMILSVVAVGGVGTVSADVANNDTTPIRVLSVDGQAVDPVVTSQTNDDVNLSRVNSDNETTNTRQSTVTVEINVTDDTPVNVTLTQADIANGSDPLAANVDTGVADPSVPNSGTTQNTNAVTGISVRDGGPSDQDGSVNGVIEVSLGVDAVNKTTSSVTGPDGFVNGERVTVAVSDSAEYDDSNDRALQPALLVEESSPNIADEALVDISEEQNEDQQESTNLPPQPDDAHPGEQVRASATLTDKSEIANAVVNLTSFESAATSAPVTLPNGNATDDRADQGTKILNDSNQVQMFLDEDDSGEIEPDERTEQLGEITGSAETPFGENGTYIARFYVSPNATTGPTSGTLAVVDDLDNVQTATTSIDVVDPNPDAPQVYGQLGDDKVTVVFPDEVSTSSTGASALTRQDFAYLDNNAFNSAANNQQGVGATSIQSVSHEPGSQVAVLTLDGELTQRDLVTSAFDPERSNTPQSDEIRVRLDEVYNSTGAVTGGPATDQSIIEARTTATFSVPKNKQGEFPEAFTSDTTGDVIDPQVLREVNPEEEIFVVAGVDTAQSQAAGESGPAVSVLADDGTNTLEKNGAVGGAPSVSGSAEFPSGTSGELGVLISAPDATVYTTVDLSKMSATGAADGQLNVTGQAVGTFDRPDQAVSGADPAQGLLGQPDIAPVGTRNLVAANDDGSVRSVSTGYLDGNAANSRLTTTVVDHTRPVIISAVADPALNASTPSSDEIDVDFSEPIQDNDGVDLDADDFEYVDNNGVNASEIVAVEFNSRGSTAVTLVTDADLTQSDVDNDEIRVVPNQIVDTEEYDYGTVDGTGSDDFIEIGNPARAGLEDGVDLSASAPQGLAVETTPGEVSGDGTITVQVNDGIGLKDEGLVTIQVTDAAGNNLDLDDDGSPEPIVVRDDGFAYIGPDSGGSAVPGRDATVLGIDQIDDSSEGPESDIVQIDIELDRVFDSGQAADGELTVSAQSGGASVLNSPGTVYNNTVSVDREKPRMNANGAVGSDTLVVEFEERGTSTSEGLYATANANEALTADDLRYLDNTNGAGATSVESVDHTAGSDTATLTLDRSLESLDLADDEVSVVDDSVEDRVGNPLVVGSPSTAIGGPSVDQVVFNSNDNVAGDTKEITVAAEANGNQLEGVDITLETDAGTFANGQQTTTVTTSATNNNYQASATLSSSSNVTATVTATAAGTSAQQTLQFGDGGDGTGDGDGTDNGDGDTFTEPIVSGGQTPVDTDGDGQFEDVNGDGTADFDDAVDLAFTDTSQLSAQQRDALDFDGDGDVDFDDAIALAFE